MKIFLDMKIFKNEEKFPDYKKFFKIDKIFYNTINFFQTIKFIVSWIKFGWCCIKGASFLNLRLFGRAPIWDWPLL